MSHRQDKPVLRFGILGTARIAEKVAAAIHAADGASLDVIGSRDADRAREWAQGHQVPRSVGDYRRVIDDPEIDAVYIPLPNSMHHAWTLAAAEAGKHVLCEKPLGIDAQQARDMAAACREHQVQLMDGVMWVHHPRTIAMKEQITSGTLGELRRVTSAFTFRFDEIPDYDIRLDPDTGGGSLGDLGWYCCRATLWAFDDLPTRVFATARMFRDVDMNLSALLWYDNQRMASFDCGFDTELRKWFEVAGTRSSLVCDDFLSPWDVNQPRFWVHNRNGLQGKHLAPTPIQEVVMIENFAQAVVSGEIREDWIDDAVATQTMCDALARSARIEQVVELDR
ncbi:MAG TPA: oxidoreductase [Planctomycetaceae bacterium]|nr:oxidoreductase [Planctomycetaceae bacterium]HAA48384.1 oxidoreductase [Planctomycetaceae bacterium]HCK52874.1 oxidoreductase [Planctomycetaceae bacterium]